jgi:arsenite-transporting ATPase
MKIVNQLDFSCVIFDTAPTGHTLRLLNFPQLLGKGLEKMISLKEKFSGVIQSVGSLFSGNHEDTFDRLFTSLDSLKQNIEVISTQFKDTTKTTFIAVCIPEFLSMYETERLIQELFKFEIDIRNIVINQVLFEGDSCKMCKSRKSMQLKYMNQIKELFEDFHITILPLQENEVRGVNDLVKFSGFLINPPQYNN